MQDNPIENISKIKGVNTVKGVNKIPSLDRICLSNEAEKIEIYVEMLKQMPQMRDELLTASHALPDPKKIAEAMLSRDSGFNRL